MGRTFGVELDNVFQANSLFAHKCSFRLTETMHSLRVNSINVLCYKKEDPILLDKPIKLHSDISTWNIFIIDSENFILESSLIVCLYFEKYTPKLNK